MSLKKTREFLEYYAKAAKGVPAGAKAEDALLELNAVRDAARAIREKLVHVEMWNRELDAEADLLKAIAEES